MSNSFSSNGQLTSPGGPGELVHTASWLDGRVVLERRHWRSCEAEPIPSRATHHRIVLTESGGTSRTHIRLDGQVIYDDHDRPGSLTFIPAHTERACSYLDADLTFSGIWIDPTIIGHFSGCDLLPSLPAIINGHDEVISTLLISLSREVSAKRTPGTAYVEHLAALILLRLADLHKTTLPKTRRGRLSQKALSLVQDYIDTNICVDITLADLAGLLAMPIDTFARQFRTTTGLAPYAYLLKKRVERAAWLLRETDRPISEIALMLGFSSQSHLTTTFRQRMGMPPQAYRQHFHPDS